MNPIYTAVQIAQITYQQKDLDFTLLILSVIKDFGWLVAGIICGMLLGKFIFSLAGKARKGFDF